MSTILLWEDPEDNLVQLRVPYNEGFLEHLLETIPFSARDSREDDRLGWNPVLRVWTFRRKVLVDDIEVNLFDRVSDLIDLFFPRVPVEYRKEAI